MELTNPWAIGDEKVWREATKIFAYLSFLIAISMFVLSFYFDSAIVVPICQFIWFTIPLLYLLIYYNKMDPLSRTVKKSLKILMN